MEYVIKKYLSGKGKPLKVNTSSNVTALNLSPRDGGGVFLPVFSFTSSTENNQRAPGESCHRQHESVWIQSQSGKQQSDSHMRELQGVW